MEFLLLDIFKPKFHSQVLPEAVPGLGLVGVVQLLPLDHQLPILHKPSVEPKVKRTFLIILRDLS